MNPFYDFWQGLMKLVLALFASLFGVGFLVGCSWADRPTMFPQEAVDAQRALTEAAKQQGILKSWESKLEAQGIDPRYRVATSITWESEVGFAGLSGRVTSTGEMGATGMRPEERAALMAKLNEPNLPCPERAWIYMRLFGIEMECPADGNG